MSNAVFTKLTELLECLEPRLPKPVCSLAVQVGEAAVADLGLDCENDGFAWVRLASASPTLNFPEAAQGAVVKGRFFWAYTIEIGVMRNYPMEEEGRVELSDELLGEKAELQMDDLLAMQQAILCCFGSSRDRIYIGPYEPVGPDSTFGGTFTIVVII